jgi:hypothetical protein
MDQQTERMRRRGMEEMVLSDIRNLAVGLYDLVIHSIAGLHKT